MTFPTLVRHDQLRPKLVRPRTKRKLKMSVALPRVSINSAKPVKAERVDINNAIAGVVLIKVFTAVLVGGLFGVMLVAAPFVSSLIASLFGFVISLVASLFGVEGIAISEPFTNLLLNAAAFAGSLFMYGVVTHELHKRA